MPKYTLKEVKLETPTVLSIVLESIDGERPFSFQPGQYAAISFNRGKRPSAMRCFSIASSPTNLSVLEFGVRVQGKYTSALQRLSPGTKFNVQGPYGSFVTSSHHHSHIVMLAGGIGITPFLSIMRHATETSSARPLLLFYSVRSQDDVPYIDELYRLVNHNPNLHIVLLIDAPGVDKIRRPITAINDRLNVEIIQKFVTDKLADSSFFICGPPPFMKGMSDSLKSLEVRDSCIITEAFSQGHDKQSGRSRNWPLNIYTVGALGALTATVFVGAADMMKSIPSSLLPKTLSTNESSTKTRSQDIDLLIQTLDSKLTGTQSPAVVAANQEAANAQATTSQTTDSAPIMPEIVTTPTNVTQPTNPAPAPKPVCTTSASGLTTCN